MANINRNQPKIAKDPRNLRVLVVPLDWGLGHATRCIPVIYELIKTGADVWIAGEGAQLAILRSHFPDLPFINLPGYQIKYARKAWWLLFDLTLQMPRLLLRIRAEHRWLNRQMKHHDFDVVISDNRYGLYHSRAASIFITHQLLIKVPFGNWIQRQLQKANYRRISRFRECWVPDFEGHPNLAGQLSHPNVMPISPIRYIGPLSRLTKLNIPITKGHLFISLSGPEPQRTELENRVIDALSHYAGTATVVRGLPDESRLIPSTNDIHFHNHLSADLYAAEMAKAAHVICRSGYSTVMDIIAMGKQAILIPTPGQPEQEYLGQYLEAEGIACQVRQSDFHLDSILEKAARFNYQTPINFDPNALAGHIAQVVNSITPQL